VTKEAGLAKFEKSVEATIPALRRYARALTQDSETADDLVHNTLLQAIRSKRQFHGGVVLGWLYGVLTDLNSDRLRLLARQPSLSPSRSDLSSDVKEPVAGRSDIESALSNSRRRHRGAQSRRRTTAAGSASAAIRRLHAVTACDAGYWENSRTQCEAGSRPLLIQSELCVSRRVVWVSICR
jgi:DNA-directed RNA polymerase specialized sigma24 family protein